VGEYYAAGVLPSNAIFARNVVALTLDNVRFDLASADARPAVVFDRVIDAAVNRFSVQASKEAESVLRLINSRDVLISAPRVLAPANVFLQAEGAESQSITIDGGDISKAHTAVSLKSGAPRDSVKPYLERSFT
jgi:hypothetical protein